MSDYKPFPKRKRTRLQGYDYALPGMYSITICTWNRTEIFGSILNGKVTLSAAGLIARMCLQELPHHYPNLRLDEFVIMPDHVHMILILDSRGPVLDRPLPDDPAESPTPASVSEIVRAFKSFASRRMHEMNLLLDQPVWQRGMNDRIIRDQAELLAKRDYIRINPLRKADN
ncbi:MAG TPA: transposase [bacterium]|jgi:hypothetical protein